MRTFLLTIALLSALVSPIFATIDDDQDAAITMLVETSDAQEAAIGSLVEKYDELKGKVGTGGGASEARVRNITVEYGGDAHTELITAIFISSGMTVSDAENLAKEYFRLRSPSVGEKDKSKKLLFAAAKGAAAQQQSSPFATKDDVSRSVNRVSKRVGSIEKNMEQRLGDEIAERRSLSQRIGSLQTDLSRAKRGLSKGDVESIVDGKLKPLAQRLGSAENKMRRIENAVNLITLALENSDGTIPAKSVGENAAAALIVP